MSRRFALVVALLVFGSLTVSPPADAGVKRSGHYFYVSSPVLEANSADATCPEGTQVVGSGGKVVTGPPSSRLRSADIVGAGNGSIVNWMGGAEQVKGYAVCTDAVSDISYVVDDEAFAFDGSATAGCADLAIGGGGQILSGAAWLGGTSATFGPGSSWSAFAGGDNSTIRATAACSLVFDDSYVISHAPDTDVVAGANRVKTGVAKCPKGTRVAAGEFEDFGVTVRSSFPWDGKDRDKTPDDGWAITIDNTGGFGDVTAEVSAVCHGPLEPT